MEQLAFLTNRSRRNNGWLNQEYEVRDKTIFGVMAPYSYQMRVLRGSFEQASIDNTSRILSRYKE